eukprot:TRINITY_DN9103_c0_g1_i1.p1 TRINITY_DN9103_c0_g1~~TRINITY_DN9103_c0_g1_i1.p1  ORF type:complete len:462 (+),score=102.32 TRINITY_DN9103_c0_g1_i1:208-1386(+)
MYSLPAELSLPTQGSLDIPLTPNPTIPNTNHVAQHVDCEEGDRVHALYEAGFIGEDEYRQRMNAAGLPPRSKTHNGTTRPNYSFADPLSDATHMTYPPPSPSPAPVETDPSSPSPSPSPSPKERVLPKSFLPGYSNSGRGPHPRMQGPMRNMRPDVSMDDDDVAVDDDVRSVSSMGSSVSMASSVGVAPTFTLREYQAKLPQAEKFVKQQSSNISSKTVDPREICAVLQSYLELLEPFTLTLPQQQAPRSDVPNTIEFNHRQYYILNPPKSRPRRHANPVPSPISQTVPFIHPRWVSDHFSRLHVTPPRDATKLKAARRQLHECMARLENAQLSAQNEEITNNVHAFVVDDDPPAVIGDIPELEQQDVPDDESTWSKYEWAGEDEASWVQEE